MRNRACEEIVFVSSSYSPLSRTYMYRHAYVFSYPGKWQWGRWSQKGEVPSRFPAHSRGELPGSNTQSSVPETGTAAGYAIHTVTATLCILCINGCQT